jgi:hypothetical protein
MSDRIITFACWCSVGFSVGWPGLVQAVEPPSIWKAGAARIDITPALPVRMAGYASRTTPSEGVAHPLAAKALAVADANGHQIVFVTGDIIAFRRSFTNRVADRVKMEFSLPRQDVAFFAAHNHAGPALPDPPDPASTNRTTPAGLETNLAYLHELEDKTVKLIGSALGKMEPVTLSYGVGRAHFALNRREPTPRGIKLGKNPAGPTDESVPVLRVAKADGKPLALLFGYACHNTTLRPDMMKIAADFAGYAQDRVEADYLGAIALFVTGCAGDSDPHPFGTLAMARDHGDELGAAVKFVLDHPGWLMPLEGVLRTAYTETTIHFSGPTDRASYERLANDSNPNRRRHAQRMLETINQGQPIRKEYPFYATQAFAIGDQLTLLALSGEVVVDYAIRLQHELGGQGRALWVAAYANDVIGYIPSVRVLKEGGYEGGEAFYGSKWPTPLAEDTETTVVSAAQEVIKTVRGRAK